MGWYFLIFISPPARSQSKIEGFVIDERGKYLPHSNVLLLQPTDSSLVKGVVSDSKGKFLLEEIPYGIYLLSGSMLGYETSFIPDIGLGQNNQAIKIILREKLSDLSEVMVEAQKPLFEQQNDRLVVNVRNSIISSGSNVLDVLSRTPGIVVNQHNNSISINGKEGVMVMLNGKLVRLPLNAVVQMLSGMNADQVEKIEIITSPPSKFDSEGNAGLINIVNHNNPEMGTNGSFSANMGYGRYERLGSSFNINHKSKKVNLFMDLSAKMDRMLMFGENHRTVLQADRESYSFLDGRREYRLWTLNGRAGVEFILGSNTTLGTQFNSYSIKSDQEAQNLTKVYGNGIFESEMLVWDWERNHWWNYSGNIHLDQKLSPKSLLMADLDYLYYFHNNPHTYDFIFAYPQENLKEEEKMENIKHTPIKMWVGKLDYQYREDKKFLLEMGIKGFTSVVNNIIQASRMRDGIWFSDTLLNQHHVLEENIGATYLSLDVELNNKSQLQVGIRYELTHNTLKIKGNSPFMKRNYGKFFPSITFSRNINNNHSYSLSFIKRITRPTYNDLAPVFTILDPLTSIVGNIELRPSISNTFQTQYQYKRVYSLKLDATHIKDLIFWDLVVDPEENTQILQKTNFGNNLNLSLSVSAPIHFTPWWESQNSLLLAGQRVRSVNQEVWVKKSMTQIQFNTTHTLNFGLGYAAELGAVYVGKGLYGLLVRRSTGSINVGIQKNLKNEAGTLKLSGEDLLLTQNLRIKNFRPELGFETEFRLRLSSRVLRLTYSRNFGSKNLKTSRKNTGAEEERKRVQ